MSLSLRLARFTPCGAYSQQLGLYSRSFNSRRGLLCLNNVNKVAKVNKGSTSQQVRDQAEREMQSFWETNSIQKRPWSPHLTVYTPPAVMNFSFLHRFTGIAMAIVWAGVGCGAFWFTGQFDPMLEYVRDMQLGGTILTSCKFVLCYPLIYHYMNGMRHLAWDYALGFPIKTCNTTGAIVTALSLVIAAGLAVLKL